MEILHTADWHSRDKDIDEVRKCLEFLVARAQEEKPDLIIHSGDSFHSRDVKAESQAARLVIETFSELADIAPVAVVLGTNSHDGRAPEILRMVRGDFPIYVATQPEQVYLINKHFIREIPVAPWQPEIVISFLPAPTKEWWSRSNGGSIAQSDQDISQALSAIFMGFGGTAAQWHCPHIVCLHGTIKGARLFNDTMMIGREIEIGRDQLELCRADLYLCGHIHASQEVCPGSNMFYSGSIYAVDIGEAGEHGFWIHETFPALDGEPDAAMSRFITTPTRKLSRVQCDMTAEGYDLQAGLDDVDFADASVRVELKAWQDEAAAIDRTAIEAQLRAKGAAEVDIRIVRVPRETVRSANIMKLTSLRDKIQELASTRGEQVTESILQKADQLEAGQAGAIL